MDFLSKKIAICMVLVTFILSVSAKASPNQKDIKVASGLGYRRSRVHSCDQDCRRNKRRRKIKETKTFFGNVRNGSLTEREKKIQNMFDRLLAGE